MGLCKCPKRKVTNQFCFEHRVNVCEDCMVASHPKCVIQSYLQWLEDSDYNPICELCEKDLVDSDCVRLVCYHLFHWRCLNSHLSSLPPDTAPAGYMCPTCKAGVFPASNLVSPVANALKRNLSQARWARVGLGLPLLEDMGDSPEESLTEAPLESRPEPLGMSQIDSSERSTSHTSVDVQAFNRIDQSGSSSRRVMHPVDEKVSAQDPDENKYKRRSALEWFSRWWKTLQRPSPRGKNNIYRRRGMLMLLVILLLLTVIAVMHYMGRSGSYNPELDPLRNPNIRVKQ